MTTRAEMEMIARIAHRARALGDEREHFNIAMDIDATHSYGMPLNLRVLYGFSNFDFMHDICGIASHLNRETYKLENHFVPRSAACYHD